MHSYSHQIYTCIQNIHAYTCAYNWRTSYCAQSETSVSKTEKQQQIKVLHKNDNYRCKCCDEIFIAFEIPNGKYFFFLSVKNQSKNGRERYISPKERKKEKEK